MCNAAKRVRYVGAYGKKEMEKHIAVALRITWMHDMHAELVCGAFEQTSANQVNWKFYNFLTEKKHDDFKQQQQKGKKKSNLSAIKG